jgi:hypothetical protein
MLRMRLERPLALHRRLAMALPWNLARATELSFAPDTRLEHIVWMALRQSRPAVLRRILLSALTMVHGVIAGSHVVAEEAKMSHRVCNAQRLLIPTFP